MTSIGAKIAFYRKAKSITQEELAQHLGVSPQAVSKWENDVACPDIMQLVPLAKLFGTTTDELLSNESVKETQLLPEGERRDLKTLLLKVVVDTKLGDKVRINLPMQLLKAALDIGAKLPQVASNEHLNMIDFQQVIAMVESGVIGKLIEVETADGDTVIVVVE